MTNKEKEISIPTVEDTGKKFPTPSDNLVTSSHFYKWWVIDNVNN